MAAITPKNKWVEDISPNSVTGTTDLIISPNAGSALLTASRTSDAPMYGSMSCEGGMDLVCNNESTVPMHAYGRYIEAWHVKGVHGASTTQGLEIASINTGPDSSSVDPFNQSGPGVTETFRAGSGKPGVGSNAISAAFQVVNVEGSPLSVYKRGFVVGNNSIAKGSSGISHAFLMPSGYAISWWKGANQLDGYITINNGCFTVYDGTGAIIFKTTQPIWQKLKSWLGI